MASAYATLAAGGIYSQPTAIRRVILANGKEDDQAGWGKPVRQARDPGRGRLHRDEDPRAERPVRDRHARQLRPAGGRQDRARPTTTPTPGSAATCPNLEATVWVGYPQGEIPMENVHGIAVAGGSFPAEIWRLFVEKATRYSPAQDFPLPKTYPVWKAFQRGRYAIQFVTTDTTSSTTTATTPTTTTAAKRPRRRARDDDPAPDDPGRAGRPLPVTTAAPPPTTTVAAADDRDDDDVLRRRPRPRRRPRAAGDDHDTHDSLRRPGARARLARRPAGDVLATPLLLGALAVPSGGLFRGAKFRDLHLYRQYGDALLDGRIPYRDFFVEYPPGAIPALRRALARARGRLRRALQGADDAVLPRPRSSASRTCWRERARAGCGSVRRRLPRARADRPRPGLAEHLRRLAGDAHRRRGRRARRGRRPAGARPARCGGGGEALRGLLVLLALVWIWRDGAGGR